MEHNSNKMDHQRVVHEHDLTQPNFGHRTFAVQRLDERAILPVRQEGSVGYDLFSIEEFEIKPGKTQKVRTGIALCPPPGYYAQVFSRSSLASAGITVHGGVIDPDYTGEIQVVIVNQNDSASFFPKHFKIAQFIFLHAGIFEMIECVELPKTVRGSNGFGSTGHKLVP